LHKNLLCRLPRHERLFTASIEIAGKVFLTPKINGSMCDVSEPWMVELLVHLLPVRAGVFCDCGVNIGQTLISVKAAEPARRYIGFEPNPECVAYVEKLIELNRLSNVLIVPVGLAGAPGCASCNYIMDRPAIHRHYSLRISGPANLSRRSSSFRSCPLPGCRTY
jgi:hypothetical protein